jgi:23S rRNA (cytosine1962-C5)-methyltransferase
VRLVHGESDGLPGFVVDRYGDTLSPSSCRPARKNGKKFSLMPLDVTGTQRLHERSDASARGLEGLPEVSGWLHGDGPTELAIAEYGWKFGLDVAKATRPAST